MYMKCIPGEKLVVMAALFAIEFSCDMDANETLAWSDFFGMVTANLIAVGNRALYINDPNSDCKKAKPAAKQRAQTPSASQNIQ